MAQQLLFYHFSLVGMRGTQFSQVILTFSSKTLKIGQKFNLGTFFYQILFSLKLFFDGESEKV